MKIVIGGLTIFLIFTFFCCSSQKTEWQGSIEEVDGVTVVNNPKEPMYGEDVFVLEEELSIGEAEGRKEYMFSRIRSIDADEHGRIYVLDRVEPQIRVFDKTGVYLYQVGNRGQGPGEIQNALYMQITPRNEVMVYDGRVRRVNIYSLDGEYIKQISSATIPFYPIIKMDSKGDFIGLTLRGKELGLKKFDLNLDHLFNIKIVKNWDDEDLILPWIYFDITYKDNIIWGFNEKYEINIISPKGETLRKINKEYSPLNITDERKREYIDWATEGEGLSPNTNIKVQRYFPPFMNLSVDEKERIFVETYEKAEDEGSYYFDVYDSLGRYVTSVPIKIGIEGKLIWKKGKLYTVEENKKGYQYVKRYRVTWNI
jgi:hypothetical protein